MNILDPPYKICRLGIIKTNQVVRPFKGLTTLGNVMVAAIYGKSRYRALTEARRRLFIG